MTKFLSLLLSFALMFTSLAPSYAQALEGSRREGIRFSEIKEALKGYRPEINNEIPSDNTRVVRPVAEREVMERAGVNQRRAEAAKREGVSRALEEAVAEAALVKQDGVSLGVGKLEEVLASERKAAAEWRNRGGASIGPAQSNGERYIGVLPRLDFLYEGEVFGEGEYHGLKLSKREWAWAGLRLDLKGMKGRVPEYEVESAWNSQLGRSEYVAGGDVIGNSVQIVKALKEYGVSEADKDLAREELAGMLKVKGLCEDKRGGIKAGDVDGKHVRGSYEYNLRTVPLCQFSLEVMEGLGVLAVQHKDKKAVDEIYNYMVAKHREGLGPMVVYQGVALLMGINSSYSYGKLKEFLKEQAHQTGGGKLLSALSYLSFEGLSRGVQEGVSEGKHLNGYTARYGYLDRNTAEGYNPDLAIDIVTAQPLTSDGKYQLPMGNVYEDIGAMLAADAMENGKSAALATDILKSSGYEWPLVSGVLLGEEGKYAHKALGQDAEKMWRGLLAADYADMNEGTQRRMKSRAAVALETSGAVSGAEVAQYLAKDEGKFLRYSRQEKVNLGLGALDILVIVVTLPLLVKGVAQGSVKVVSKLRNFGQFSARMARNGAQSLRRVPGKVASGAREVKAAAGRVVTKVKEAPARVRAATAERKAAVLAQESASARRAEQAAGELAEAERAVAREMARIEQSGVQTAYKPAVVYNALGQARMGWVPVEPVKAVKPSLWQSFLEGSKNWGSNFVYEAGQAFGDMGRALKRQTGFAVMALGMNLTPLPSAAVQGLARAESALGKVVRTEQVMTAAPVMAAGETAPFVLGSLEAVRTVSPAVNNVIKASILPSLPVRAAGSSVPWSASLMFPAVAVTPTEERRLGLGNFFKFKVGKPQFLTNYLNEEARYNRLMSLNGGEPQRDEAWESFQKLQQRKMQYALNQNATQLYWQREGYPVTGQIQGTLAGAWEGNYLYNIAPWLYRNNPYYQANEQAINQHAEQAQQQAQQTAEVQPVVAQQPAASGNSGYLYSGLPIFAFADTFKFIRNVYRQVSANRHARGVLGRKKPLATELRDILGNQNVSEKYKKQALLRLYGEFNVFDQIIKTLPEESQTVISHYTKAGDNEGLSSVLYSLYQGKVFDQPLTHLSNHIPIEQFSQELDEIIASPEFYAESHMVYDDTPMLSAESNLFTGVVRSLQEVNREAVLKASRVKGWAAQNASSGVEVKGGWIYYKNDIPVYYRYADGTLSATPVAVLHQEPSSWLAAILSKIPLVPLSSPIGMKVPKGMVLALDENGKFKYVRQPGHLAEMLSSKAGRKNMKDLYEQGSNAVEVDTPYSTTDLLAIAKMLEASPNVNFQITLNESSSFKQFVNMLGMFFGMNVDSVMVAPFKKAAGDVESPVVQSTAPNMFGGVGYVTPRAAGELVPHMQKWGMDKSTFTILTLSLGTLLLSWAAGINGITPTDHFSLPVLALPMVVLVLASSLLRSSAPLLLNHYKDPQMRTAANLQMSTFQQLSRVVLAGVTFLWPMLIAGGNDFVAVPAAAFMAAVTLGLFINTPMWKNVSASIQNVWKHPKSVLPSLWAGLKVAMPSLGKGLLSGIMAPFIDAWNGIKDKITSKGTTYSDDDEGRYKQAYDEEFLTQQETKDSLQRVTLAYASYAASVMLLNQVAGTVLGDWGQAAVTLFAVASLLVRHNASKWVAKGKFTDDQLTGISFSGLALMPLALGLLPYDGGIGWMIALVAAGIGLNMSTAVPGQLDNTRLQNNVTATMQERKNKVLQDQSLTAEQKKAKIADLEKMEKYWAGWASKAYSKANANGIYGIYAAVIASGVLSMIPGDWSGLAARIIFLYAAAVAAAGAWKTKGMAGSFLKALFTKRQSVNITEEDMLSGSVSYKTFNISEDKKKATTMLMDLWKGKSNSIKTLRNKLAPYGVVTIASEVKMTDILKRMIEIHNRLVALSEVLGYANVKPAFEDLYILAQDYEQVLEQSQLSESLNREFDKLILSLTGSESLDFGVAEAPVYMEEGQFALPARHQDFLRAKDLINELEVLAKNIKRGGSAVTSDTYGQFIRYHEAAKKLLQEYAFANPSETLRVKTEEKRLGAICRGLKLSNEKSNTLWNNAGPVSDKDVQTLEDILQAY